MNQRKALGVWDIKTLDEMYGTNAENKPKVNSSVVMDESTLAVTIIGEVVDEGASPLIKKTIYWKRVGDSDWQFKDFDNTPDDFEITLSDLDCGAEYLFYTTATNSYGTSSSIVCRKLILTYSLSFSEITANSVKISVIINKGNYIKRVSISDNLPGISVIDNNSDKFEVVINDLKVENTYNIDQILFFPTSSELPFVTRNIDYSFTTLPETTIQIDSFTDSRDNKTYKTVKIGEQWWMSENLAYLPSVSPPSDESSTKPYYYVNGYKGTSISVAIVTDNYINYGVLYNWSSASIACPSGWHLPSDNEWKQLEMYIGMSQSEVDGIQWRGTDEGTKLKATNGWDNNGDGTDDFGFSGLPGGFCYNSGNLSIFQPIGTVAGWWSATESNSDYAWLHGMVYSRTEVSRNDANKMDGWSVRCIKD